MNTSRLILEPRLAREFAHADRRLVEIILDALIAWPVRDLLMGDIHRTREEEDSITRSTGTRPSGIHATGAPHRAADCRTANIDGSVAERWAHCREVAGIVNARWVYDPRRPSMVVAYAGEHGTGPHLHLQVHPGTQRRGDRVDDGSRHA